MRTFEPWDQIGTVHSTMSCEVTGCGSRAEFKREYVDWPDPGKLQVFPENTIGRLGCDFVCGPHKVKIMAIESGELTAPEILSEAEFGKVKFRVKIDDGVPQVYLMSSREDWLDIANITEHEAAMNGAEVTVSIQIVEVIR